MAETTMTTISSPNTGDKYTHIHHKSGLEILVCEMEGFSTTEAMFGTKYGSINTQFKTAADKDYCTVPEASPTSWNTSCSRTRTATSLTCTPRPAQAPMRSPLSTRPAISSAAPTTSRHP